MNEKESQSKTDSSDKEKNMQAIELDTNIEPDGSIRLPENYKSLFGKHARIIVLVPEETNKIATNFTEMQEINKVLKEAWGAWGNKTLDEVDKEIAEMRDAEWKRDISS